MLGKASSYQLVSLLSLILESQHMKSESSLGYMRGGFERKAVSILGRAKFEAMQSSFRLSADHDGKIESAKVEQVLRANGFCPTLSEVNEIKADLERNGSRCDMPSFFELSLKCVSMNSDTGLAELMQFFSPMDPDNLGIVQTKVFRAMMLHCGEKFPFDELERVIDTFQSNEHKGYINYRKFITTITSG